MQLSIFTSFVAKLLQNTCCGLSVSAVQELLCVSKHSLLPQKTRCCLSPVLQAASLSAVCIYVVCKCRCADGLGCWPPAAAGAVGWTELVLGPPEHQNYWGRFPAKISIIKFL